MVKQGVWKKSRFWVMKLTSDQEFYWLIGFNTTEQIGIPRLILSFITQNADFVTYLVITMMNSITIFKNSKQLFARITF